MSGFDFSNDPREVPAYSLREAAQYLDVPSSTVRAWFAGQSCSHQGARKRFQAVMEPADKKSLGLSSKNFVEAYVLAAIRRKHRIGLPTIRNGLAHLKDKALPGFQWVEGTLSRTVFKGVVRWRARICTGICSV